MMTIAMPLNLVLRKEQKILLNTPLSNYPGVPLTQLENASSDRKIDLRGGEVFSNCIEGTPGYFEGRVLRRIFVLCGAQDSMTLQLSSSSPDVVRLLDILAVCICQYLDQVFVPTVLLPSINS